MKMHNLPYFFPETLSSTRDISLFTSCQYKWFLQRILYLCKHAENVDLEAGSEFAKAHEITRTAYYQQNIPMEEAVALGVKHIETVYAETFEREKFKNDLKTPSRLAEVFKAMYEQDKLENQTIVPFEMEDGSLSVEQTFSVELPFKHPETGKPLQLKCILDLLGVHNDKVYVMDDKTCKSVLEDRAIQTDLLRTQNQFVQYVTVGNMNKEKFGNLEITHVRINRAKIKKNYAKGEKVVEPYECEVDIWYQKTWWNNLLHIVQDMLQKYDKFIQNRNVFAETGELLYEVVFPRVYGNACEAFFRPCMFAYHCTSGTAQNFDAQGFKQVVNNSQTKGLDVGVEKYRRFILNNEPLPVLEEKQLEEKKIVSSNDFNLESFLDSF